MPWRQKKAGENLARSVVKIISCAESDYSAFFSAFPNFVFGTVNLSSPVIPSPSTSSFATIMLLRFPTPISFSCGR